MNRILVASTNTTLTRALLAELTDSFDVVTINEPCEAGAEISRQEPLTAVVADMDFIDVLAEVQRYHPAAMRMLMASDDERDTAEALIPSAVASRVIEIPWPRGIVRAAIEHHGARSRLLVAEEDAELLGQIRSWLADDYDVSGAPDGEHLLRQAFSERPDVVIVASSLPGLSGESVAWVMKNDSRLRGIPVVLASERPGDTRDIDAFLPKPYGREDLLEILDQVLPAASIPALAASEDERRLIPRMTVQIPGHLLVEAREAEALIVSLSLGGAYAETDIAVDAGAHGLLSFACPDGPFQAECDVVRRGERLGRKGLGVRFAALGREAQALLLRALADQALPPTVDPTATP